MNLNELAENLTSSNFELLTAIEDYDKSIEECLEILTHQNLALTQVKQILKKILHGNKTTNCKLKKHLSDTMDFQTSLSKNMRDNESISQNHTEALKIAKQSQLDNKLMEIKTSAIAAKNSLIVHQFEVPKDTSNGETIRRLVRDKLTELKVQNVTFSVLRKSPKDQKVSVLFTCTDQDKKKDLDDCLKDAGIKTSVYNNQYLHKFMSNARKIYLDTTSERIEVPKADRHVMLRTNYNSENILVFVKDAKNQKWDLVETLKIPVPKKWLSEFTPQTCISKIVDISSCIPNDF